MKARYKVLPSSTLLWSFAVQVNYNNAKEGMWSDTMDTLHYIPCQHLWLVIDTEEIEQS